MYGIITKAGQPHTICSHSQHIADPCRVCIHLYRLPLSSWLSYEGGIMIPDNSNHQLLVVFAELDKDVEATSKTCFYFCPKAASTVNLCFKNNIKTRKGQD